MTPLALSPHGAHMLRAYDRMITRAAWEKQYIDQRYASTNEWYAKTLRELQCRLDGRRGEWLGGLEDRR